MKTYKMSSNEIKSLNISKIKTYIILLILLILPIIFFGYYNGFSIWSLVLLLTLLVQAVFSITSTGIHSFKLADNTLSHLKNNKVMNTFDLKQVRVISTIGENESTLVIKVDGVIKARYHSEILGITTFNQLLTDVSVINDGTYQS